MNAKLAKGQKVNIYHDPITQQKLEGKATLVKFCHEDDTLEHWDVRFKGEREVYQRWVAKPQPKSQPMNATKMSGHTPTPWIVAQSGSCDARIESPSNVTNWCLTGIECHPQYNGSGKSHGPDVLVSKEEAQTNAAFIIRCCNEWEALNAVVEAADMALQEYDAPPIGLSGNRCGIIAELRTALAALAKLREEKR